MQPTATTARVTPWPLSEFASSSASTESFLADSIKPHVLTSATSACSTSSTNVQPSAANRPANSSESTSLRAQPRVTTATVRLIGVMLQVNAYSYEVTPYETETTSPSLPICWLAFPFTETSTAPALPTLRLTRVVALKFNFWPFLI